MYNKKHQEIKQFQVKKNPTTCYIFKDKHLKVNNIFRLKVKKIFIVQVIIKITIIHSFNFSQLKMQS